MIATIGIEGADIMDNLDIFSHHYDTVVSLGDTCMLSRQLKDNDVYNTKSPFDWIITSSTTNVAKLFDDNFHSLFLPENLQIDPVQDDSYHTVLLTDTSSGFRSLHDISKESLSDKSFQDLYIKFQYKVKSLYARIEASQRILFIRTLNQTDDSTVMLSLGKSITARFPNKDIGILFVKPSKDEQHILISNNMHLICSDIKYRGINGNIEWLGDYGNWKKILSKIKTSSHKNTYLNSLERLLQNDLTGRKVVIWGMRYLFSEIEHLLIKYKSGNYFAYDKNLSKQYCSSPRILQNTNFLSENKPFVIVNTESYFEEIITSLSSNHFKLMTDYYYF